MFVEQQQPPGQKLLGFDILGETPGYESEGYRRFLAQLRLAEPEDSVVVAYYVFGQGPVWVYRSEDFDMIMHMDKSMMPAPPALTPGDPDRPSIPDAAPRSNGRVESGSPPGTTKATRAAAPPGRS